MFRGTKNFCSLLLITLLALPPAFCQEPETKPAQGSTLEVKPGTPAIKSHEIRRNEPVGPLRRLPYNILKDQKAIWTSPFHTSKSDAKWWTIFGVSAATLIATDRWTSRELPNTPDQISVAKWTSRIGAAYSLLPLSGAFYLIGTGTHDERFRETGILGFEALADAYIAVNVLKVITDRERPLENAGHGRFWHGNGQFWNEGSSFPSGHAIESWALASVIAHEYPRPLIVPILSYGLATVICGSRFAARKHFAADVVVGAGMGWFIGDFVYARRHNQALDGRRSKLQSILARIRIGGGAPPIPIRPGQIY